MRPRVTGRIERCVPVGLPQQALPPDNRVLKALGDYHRLRFGVYTEVTVPGTASLRDTVRLA